MIRLERSEGEMGSVVYGDRIGKRGKITIGCSAAIFDTEKQKILLVRRADNNWWAVPGGFMEAGESVTEGCEREHSKRQQLIAIGLEGESDAVK